MDSSSDNSSYMRMISESHVSSTPPLVYTCSPQSQTFHCMKGYRQLTAYDGVPFDSATASYPTIKQEPIDYTTCDNPYEQGLILYAYRKHVSLHTFISKSYNFIFWVSRFMVVEQSLSQRFRFCRSLYVSVLIKFLARLR